MTIRNLYCEACLDWTDHVWDVEMVRVSLRPMDDKELHGWRCDECGTIVLSDGQVVYSDD